MSETEKTLTDVLSGVRDSNIRFRDLRSLLNELGFECRIKGDHYIYYKTGIPEIINIQPAGSKAKPYQVHQIRNIILRYHLGGELHAEI